MTNVKIQSGRFIPPIIAVVTGLFLTSAAFAQQRQKYSFNALVPGKYTEQHVIEVGDFPGHQIRVAALNTKYSDEAPTFDGVRVTESSGWISSDYTGGSGRFIQYIVLQMANGDKIYEQAEGLAHTFVGSDGSRKTTYSTVTYLKGGSGKFTSIRGVLRGSGATDFKTGPTNNTVEGEYWFEK